MTWKTYQNLNTYLKKNVSVCVCVHVYKRMHKHMVTCPCVGHRTVFQSQFSPSPLGPGDQMQVVGLSDKLF